MFAVVGFHRCFELFERAVERFFVRHIYLCRCRPQHYDTADTFLLLEVLYVLAQFFYHSPTCYALLHVVAVNAFRIVFVESSLQWLHGFKLIAYRFDVLCFQNFGIDSRLISVLRVHVPCSEHDIVHIGNWYDVFIVKIFLVFSFTNTYLVVLCHCSDRLCQAFASH